ncbi:MAG: hypothetical protein KAI66_05790 [Lentisphaeria bacterium]|nr:hypothetical protein [Lentisphaeria bacterium]
MSEAENFSGSRIFPDDMSGVRLVRSQAGMDLHDFARYCVAPANKRRHIVAQWDTL